MKDAKRPATGRHRPFTPEFRAEAVRLVLSTGRPNHVVADELGIGSSTLGKWVAAAKEADLLSGPHSDATKELAHFRAQNRDYTPDQARGRHFFENALIRFPWWTWRAD